MMGSPREIPPGEPILALAILQAAKFNGAGYVHQHEGIPGWHVGDKVPRGVPAYFRVVGNRIYGRTSRDDEYFFGTIENGVIVPKEKASR